MSFEISLGSSLPVKVVGLASISSLLFPANGRDKKVVNENVEQFYAEQVMQVVESIASSNCRAVLGVSIYRPDNCGLAFE